ncbi:MAG: hypothetical protein ACYTHN_10460, partial [Planctomycetota bacterium]
GWDKEAAKKKAEKVYKQFYRMMLIAAKEQKSIDSQKCMDQVARAHGFKDWGDFATKTVKIIGPQDWMELVKKLTEWYSSQVKAMTEAMARGEEWHPEGETVFVNEDKASQVLRAYFGSCIEAKAGGGKANHEKGQERVSMQNGFMGWTDFVTRAAKDLGAEKWNGVVDQVCRWYELELKKIEEVKREAEAKEREIAAGPLNPEKAFLVLRDYYRRSMAAEAEMRGGSVLESRDLAAKAFGFTDWDDYVAQTKKTLGSQGWVDTVKKAHEWYRQEKGKATGGGGGGMGVEKARAVFREFYARCLQAAREKKTFDSSALQNEVAREFGFQDWNDYVMRAATALGPEEWQRVVKETVDWYSKEMQKAFSAPPGEPTKKAEPQKPVPGSTLDLKFRPGARLGDAKAKAFFLIHQVMGEWIRGDLFSTEGEKPQVVEKQKWIHVPSQGWEWTPVGK